MHSSSCLSQRPWAPPWNCAYHREGGECQRRQERQALRLPARQRRPPRMSALLQGAPLLQLLGMASCLYGDTGMMTGSSVITEAAN